MINLVLWQSVLMRIEEELIHLALEALPPKYDTFVQPNELEMM